ncbi:MAG TPA: AI-2E family transporter YdiK [Candidatus Deferrimicrobiaceae bacterium]|nr:AI-2E family transporter YdiK [Candidatus Deferrimicrobiaceae bacterium]
MDVGRDVTRTTLGVLLIGTLIVASIWILLPLLTSILWATTIVVTTWPVMVRFQGWLRGKRWLAVTMMTVLLLLVFIVPVSLAVSTIVAKVGDIEALRRSLATFTIPPPPAWLDRFPMAGPKIEAAWEQYAALSREELSARLTPYAGTALRWFAAQAGSMVVMFLQFLLTVIISAILYAKGEAAASGVRSFARRLAGQPGEDAVNLSAKAIRGVALGIVVTAMIQTSIGGIGVFIAGVPLAGILTAVMFILCLAQVGPALVLIPAVIWLYSQGSAMWGTILVVVTVLALTIDNVVRPVLIGKGAGLPLILVIAGVIGGLVALGVIGLFIGPVVLAVSYTLLETWVLGGEPGKEAGEGG